MRAERRHRNAPPQRAPLAAIAEAIPGIGPITASAMAASVQDASGFAGPREFAAFLGLTPKQNSSAANSG